MIPISKHYAYYLKNIYETYVSGDAREESFYPYLKEFLEEYARVSKESLRVTVSPKKIEAGTPDFLLRDEHKKIIGYIEAKGPEVKDLDDISETEQLKR